MKITKYGNVGQMLEAYYGPRLEAYEERRKKEMERIAKENFDMVKRLH